MLVTANRDIRAESRVDAGLWATRIITGALVALVCVGAALWFSRSSSAAAKLQGRVIFGVSAGLGAVFAYSRVPAGFARWQHGRCVREVEGLIRTSHLFTLIFAEKQVAVPNANRDLYGRALDLLRNYYDSLFTIRADLLRDGGRLDLTESQETFGVLISDINRLLGEEGRGPLAPEVRARLLAESQLEVSRRLAVQ